MLFTSDAIELRRQLDATEQALNDAGIDTIYMAGLLADLPGMVRRLHQRATTRIKDLERKVDDLEFALVTAEDGDD